MGDLLGLKQATERRDGEHDCETADRLPADLRKVVHEYGLSTVRAFIQQGVTEPRKIRALVHAVFLGAREPGNRRPSMGSRNGIETQIDQMLLRSGSAATARTFIRELYAGGGIIMNLEPDDRAIQASMETVADFSTRVSKEEKHRRRLRAAYRATYLNLWPWLKEGADV